MSDHRPAAIRPPAPSSCAIVTSAPADPADQPRSVINHTSVNVHTTTCGATSRTDTAWMRHSTDEPRYGLARSCSVASARGGRGGSFTATAHTTADTAHTTAGNNSATETPWLSARRGITKAPKPTPNGWAVCRMPITRPRWCGGNQPTTNRPLAELLLAAAIPPSNKKRPDCDQ